MVEGVGAGHFGNAGGFRDALIEATALPVVRIGKRRAARTEVPMTGDLVEVESHQAAIRLFQGLKTGIVDVRLVGRRLADIEEAGEGAADDVQGLGAEHQAAGLHHHIGRAMFVGRQLVIVEQPQAAIIVLLCDDAKVVVEVGNDFARADIAQAREFMLDGRLLRQPGFAKLHPDGASLRSRILSRPAGFWRRDREYDLDAGGHYHQRRHRHAQHFFEGSNRNGIHLGLLDLWNFAGT